MWNRIVLATALTALAPWAEGSASSRCGEWLTQVFARERKTAPTVVPIPPAAPIERVPVGQANPQRDAKWLWDSALPEFEAALKGMSHDDVREVRDRIAKLRIDGIGEAEIFRRSQEKLRAVSRRLTADLEWLFKEPTPSDVLEERIRKLTFSDLNDIYDRMDEFYFARPELSPERQFWTTRRLALRALVIGNFPRIESYEDLVRHGLLRVAIDPETQGRRVVSLYAYSGTNLAPLSFRLSADGTEPVLTGNRGTPHAYAGERASPITGYVGAMYLERGDTDGIAALIAIPNSEFGSTAKYWKPWEVFTIGHLHRARVFHVSDTLAGDLESWQRFVQTLIERSHSDPALTIELPLPEDAPSRRR